MFEHLYRSLFTTPPETEWAPGLGYEGGSRRIKRTSILDDEADQRFPAFQDAWRQGTSVTQMFGERPFTLFGSVGASGADNHRADVAKVETFLHRTGHYKPMVADGPNGWASTILTDSIRRFQKDNGLEIDGILQPDGPTLSTLAQTIGPDDDGEAVAYIPPAPQPAPPPSPTPTGGDDPDPKPLPQPGPKPSPVPAPLPTPLPTPPAPPTPPASGPAPEPGPDIKHVNCRDLRAELNRENGNLNRLFEEYKQANSTVDRAVDAENASWGEAASAVIQAATNAGASCAQGLKEHVPGSLRMKILVRALLCLEQVVKGAPADLSSVYNAIAVWKEMQDNVAKTRAEAKTTEEKISAKKATILGIEHKLSAAGC
ncbi:MAG: peptidoglycan-binding protein [Magnetospirillum sp.]|nr:peptidoglycan-binding protein [Magnetospirillum sp.]